MRILQVIDQLNIGGAERVLVDLSNILYGRGHEVDVLTLVRVGKLGGQLDSGIRVHNLGRMNKLSVIKLFQCNRICSQYDVVHIHLRYNFRYVALAKWLFWGQYNILLHDHFGDIENDAQIPFGIKFFLFKNPWFAGVSQTLVNWAENRVGLRSTQVFLLSNIIVRKDVIPELHQSEYSKVKILNISNFREAKHHTFALKLIAALRDHFPLEVSFIGQVIDSNYFEAIVSEINQRNLESIITIRHDCEDVQDIMQGFDLAIHTAYQESGPLVLIEYLAQKLPFIAYKTGEVSTQVSSTIPEFFMVDFDIPKWVERIKAHLENRATYVLRMETAFQDMYSSEVYYKNCINIYNHMLHER